MQKIKMSVQFGTEYRHPAQVFLWKTVGLERLIIRQFSLWKTDTRSVRKRLKMNVLLYVGPNLIRKNLRFLIMINI